MAEIKLVIFDCDGVLIDSETIAAKAELSVYSRYGLKIDTEEFAQRFAGSSSVDILKQLEPELDLPVSASMLDEIHAAVDEQCAKQAQMIPDADIVLDLFDQPRCICSNSPQHRLKAMLSRVGLHDRFKPYIFSSKDFEPPRNKPKPDVFLKALEEFKVDGHSTVVVEDSVHGVAAGVAAGIRIIGFTGASHTYPGHGDALVSAGAETVIRRLKDLPATIEAFRQWENFVN
ncbi:MAG: HAD family phosphatase [Bacteroidetes bacterium]|nr:HAD family phosphatase [Bacteroidota bacterium]